MVTGSHRPAGLVTRRFSCLFAGVLFLVVGPGPAAQACQPCRDVLSRKDTAARAELTVIGRPLDSPFQGQPASVRVKLLQVIKGEMQADSIRVRSWYGMCRYGLALENGVYLLFLQKTADVYEPVEQGCSEYWELLEGIDSADKIGADLVNRLKRRYGE